MMYSYQVVSFSNDQVPSVQVAQDRQEVYELVGLAIDGGYSVLVTALAVQSAAEKDIAEATKAASEQLRQFPPEELAATAEVFATLSTAMQGARDQAQYDPSGPPVSEGPFG